MKLKTRKCSHCGTENVYGVKTCVSCHSSLEERKSCPRCAKWNSTQSPRCVHCGYSFMKKKHVLFINLFCSFLLMGILAFFLFLGKDQLVEKISMFLKLGALVLFLGILISIFTYGEKEKIAYSAEEDMVKRNLFPFKRFSFIVMAFGFLSLLGIFFYLFFR